MLSVIVPVYQCEKYLEECIESILKSSYSDFEIVLIDDGSKDRSGPICDAYAQKNNKIRVFHTENRGPYQARKRGVKEAKGDVITFVDADDWIESNTYEELMSLFEQNGVDILCSAYCFNENGKKVFNHCAEGIYSKSEIEKEIIPNMIWDFKIGDRGLNSSLCNKIMKKKVFEKVTEGIDERIVLGEDALTTYPAICLANKIMVINKEYYHYRVNNESCTNSLPIERLCELQTFNSVFREIMGRVSKYELSPQIDCYVRLFFNMIIVNWLGVKRSSQMYMFPFSDIPQGSKIALYGAGDVGRSYYTSIIQSGYVDLAAWYDKKASEIGSYNDFPIKGAELIDESLFDYILIAILNIDVFKIIKQELINLGISENKIVWVRPISIG